MKKYIFIVLLVMIANYIISNFLIEPPYPNPQLESFFTGDSKHLLFQQNKLYSNKIFLGLSTITIGLLGMFYKYKEKYTL